MISLLAAVAGTAPDAVAALPAANGVQIGGVVVGVVVVGAAILEDLEVDDTAASGDVLEVEGAAASEEAAASLWLEVLEVDGATASEEAAASRLLEVLEVEGAAASEEAAASRLLEVLEVGSAAALKLEVLEVEGASAPELEVVEVDGASAPELEVEVVVKNYPRVLAWVCKPFVSETAVDGSASSAIVLVNSLKSD